MILDEKTYVDQAERAILELAKNKDKRGNTRWITTSKIRNLLAMTADIYNDVLTQKDVLTDVTSSRIEYLRIRFIYECGREPLVKQFVEQTKLLDAMKEIKNSRKQYILFTHYMEALVAYHKYYGGKDQ